jgi:hypothetical protein
MMLLLLYDDPPQRPHGVIIHAGQFSNLFLHVPENDPFDGDCGSRNRLPPSQTGHASQNEAAQPAPKVASAPALAPSRQLGSEERAMAALMGEEVVEFRQHIGGSPPREPPLREVDADCAMFTGVINLHHPVAERLPSVESCYESHAPIVR